MSPAARTFELYSLRYYFRARDPFDFPTYLTGNIFRGALGSFLQSADKSAYKLLFASAGPGSKGLETPPRPFVFRCRNLDGRTFSAGEAFALELNLFLPDLSILPGLSAAFLAMSEAGFGTTRSRATLLLPPEQSHHCISLESKQTALNRLRLHFETPTDLKMSDKLGEPLAFAHLMRLVCQRLDRLQSIYGSAPLGLDWKALRKAAVQVHIGEMALRAIDVSRRGSRTGQTHSLGGFVGHADYLGDITRFLPLLKAACFTGVGRHTAWGNGELRVELPK